MKTRQLAIGLSVLAVALSGCATAQDPGGPVPTGGADSAAAAQQAAGRSQAPGQPAASGHSHTMASGETMAGHSHPTAPGQTVAGGSMTQTGSQPSKASKMVCAGDVPAQVQTVLQLSAPAPTSTSWQDQLYTCTYTLPMGKMVLSVKEAASRPAARAYFEALRAELGSTEPLLAVGEQAYATKTGTAVVLKDSMTLRVDTTGLPAVFGPQQQRRTDLAYEMATIVMGCWVDHQ